MARPATKTLHLQSALPQHLELVRLQQGIQRHMQAEVRAHLGDNPPALERYYRDYLRDLRRPHRASSYGEMHQAMLEADLVLIGDYHTLRQSQEAARRLLERAALDARPVCLALEMVHAEQQPQLDAFLRGDLLEGEFLDAIRYRQNWNFAWRHYRPLLQAAHRLGIPVVGINHSAAGDGIRGRDARIADSVLEVRRAHPEHRILVLVGDMHLASNHLPAALDRRAEESGVAAGRRLIVYQNSDALYWDLAAEGAEVATQVVRMGPGRFCVMEVPPFVKLQSYLGWEREQEEFAAAWSGDGSELTSAAVVEHLVAQLAAFLSLPAVDGACDVYTNLDDAFFEALAAAEDLGEERAREIRILAFSNRSCTVPELNLVYLPYLSVHHAAEEAMHLLLARVAGDSPAADARAERFYARVLWAALGYAASKIVNGRRETPGEAAFRAFLRSASRELQQPELAFRKLVARFVVQHKDHEHARRRGRRGRLQQIYQQQLEIELEVTQALGYMLGEGLAAAVRRGDLGRAALRALVLDPTGGACERRYFDLADQLHAKT